MPITYNTTLINATYIYRATSGGTVFSANEAGNTAFDYFSDTAVANDAIYFGNNGTASWSDLTLNIGTAMAGTDIVLIWEYYCSVGATWRAIHDLTDGSTGFTTTGAVRVVFPLQAKSCYLTVNGIVNKNWIRCRIVSLTAITEGGANITDRVQISDGLLDITGYTDGSPCTWTIVYNWIVANAPRIGAWKWGTQTFKFDNVYIKISSRLRSTYEKIFLGNGCYNGGFNLSYLHSGVLVGTNGWTQASSYFLCYSFSSQILVMSTVDNTKIYGGVWEVFTNIVDGITCGHSGIYLGMSSGEWRGVYTNYGGFFNTAVCDRCMVNGNLITSFNPSVYPTNLSIANSGDSIWILYGNSLTVRDITYALPVNSLMYFGTQYAAQGQTISITNPNPAFPVQTSAPRVCNRTLGTLANLTQCKFYDASAETYTDYLTEASSDAVDDVPINGDVGDCLYFISPGISASSSVPALSFTITNQSNDYVYIWEQHKAAGWSLALSFNTTSNLTTSGIVYLGLASLAAVTINGTSGFWYRLRIVTKGTGTPMVSKIRSRAQTGIMDIKVNEKYSIVYTIVNELGVGISGATVKITDNAGTSTSLTTNGSGLTTSTDFITSQTAFDKDTSETDFNYKKTNLNPFTIVISKLGYETYNAIVTLNKKVEATIKLRQSISPSRDDMGEEFR